MSNKENKDKTENHFVLTPKNAKRLAILSGQFDEHLKQNEAQNTSRAQMKMFLTRIGFGSKVVVTGDITQTDLPPGKKSGLQHALIVLENIPHISRTFFDAKDVVRHPLVQAIVEAYESQLD